MKVFIIIMLASVLQVTAGPIFAQKITLNEKNARLSDIIDKISRQSGYDFIYTEKITNNIQGLNIMVNNESVEQVLNKVLAGQPLTYTLEDRLVVISSKSESSMTLPVQQVLTLTGRVLDKVTQRPIPGVTVGIKSSRITAQTASDGTFTITGSQGTTLVFSYIGYRTHEITVGNQTNFLIQLEEIVNELEGVVVTGMFIRSAETATGAQTVVSREQLLNAGTINVVQSLRNIDPSFIIMENRLSGSDPNALPDINIRGQSGLPDLTGDYATNPNLPLFILDGFETSLQRILDLDIYRINSVTLLKDAASKAIYGAKAANGVVVVETVRPLPGEIRISYNTNIGYEIPDLSSYQMTNARQKLEAEVLAGVYDAPTASAQYELMQQYNAFLANIEMGAETDWMAKPLRNGVRQSHSLNFSGGDPKFTYGATVSYNTVEGGMKGSSSKTLNGNVNLMYRFNNFNLRNDLTVGSRKGENSPWGAYSSYVSMNPYLAYTDQNGNITQVAVLRNRPDADPGNVGIRTNSTTYNPAYNATLNTFDLNNTTTITNNINLDWIIRPGLRATGRFGFTQNVQENDTYLPAQHNSFIGVAQERRGSYQKSDGKGTNYDGQLNVSYSRVIDKHALTLNSGTNVSQNSSYSTGFITEGFPNDRLSFPSLGLQYQLNSRPSGSESMSRDMGLYGSTNYSFDQRYNLDFTYRASQSSQYGTNSRWAHLWSAGVSWNLHNEKFIQKIDAIDQFRIRASTGFTGSQGFNTYLGIGSYTYDRTLTYSGGNAATLMGMANPNLRWQRRQDHNLGLDMAFLRKLSARADYAIAYTDGLLTDITLPPSTGFGSYKANLGRVKNRTVELNLTYNAYQNTAQRNSLSFFVGLSQNRNTLLEISNSLAAYNESQNALSNQGANAGGMTAEEREANLAARREQIARPKILFVEGQSMNAIYAVRSLGIDPATGRERYLREDGTTTYDWHVNDQVVVGNSLPDWRGNFGFNLAYKGFRANTIFRIEYGGQLYNETLVSRVENADIYNNVDIRVLTDRWQKPGDVAFFKSITDRTVTRVSSRFVEDNNTLTLASLQIGYDLDRLAAVRAWGFSQLRASISSAELFHVSTMRIERGTSYPFARTIQFTLNANF